MCFTCVKLCMCGVCCMCVLVLCVYNIFLLRLFSLQHISPDKRVIELANKYLPPQIKIMGTIHK